MKITRILRLLLAKRELDRNLRARKAIRDLRREAALRGKITEHRNRVARQRQTWGEIV